MMRAPQQAAMAAAGGQRRSGAARTSYTQSFCTRDTARCPDARSYSVDLRECCRGHIVEIMATMQRLLDAAGVTWWIDYGTLLGAVRNPLLGLPPGIVPHDKDGDCGFLATHTARFKSIIPKLEELGYKVTEKARKPGGTFVRGGGDYIAVCLSVMNETNVDFFPWHDNGAGYLIRQQYTMNDRFKGRHIPRSKLLPLTRIKWEGLTVPAPADPVWFVAHRYGANWRIPVRANNDRVRR